MVPLSATTTNKSQYLSPEQLLQEKPYVLLNAFHLFVILWRCIAAFFAHESRDHQHPQKNVRRHIKRFELVKAVLVLAATLPLMRTPLAAQSTQTLRETKIYNAKSHSDAKIQRLRLRAEKGRAEDEIKLAVALQTESGRERDQREVAQWFLRAANQGDPVAQTDIAYLYLNGSGVPRDEQQAFKWFQRAAVENYAPAQAGLSYLLLSGKGVKQDQQSSALWLRRAAEHGFEPAEVNLGIFYAWGTGVEQDEAEALRWIRKAAQKHFAPAEFLLGTMFETGIGASKNPEEASQWYSKAAVRGYPPAQNNLGRLYEIGAGVPKNLELAARWYHLAAKQGYGNACANLARAYADGIGVKRDYTSAYFWWRLAQRSGSTHLQPLGDFAERLSRRITAKEAAGIQIQVEEWSQSHPFLPKNWSFVEVNGWSSGHAVQISETVTQEQRTDCADGSASAAVATAVACAEDVLPTPVVR